MTILENKPVDYNHPLLPPLDQNFKLEHPIQMHCFWRGTFGEKQFGSLKSLFATQKSYEYNVTLWYTGTLTIDKIIESEFAEFRKRYNDRFHLKEFVVENELDESDERLKGLKKILVKDEKGASQFFADDVRVTCLYKYGGLYFDLDCLFLRDMKDTYSYHNFCYAWEFQKYGNSAILYIEEAENNTIKQIVDVAIQCKSCHPCNIVSYNRQYDEFYVFPCWCFDPSWLGCVQNVPINKMSNNYNIFQETNQKVVSFVGGDIGLFPCSYVWHWHNRWNEKVNDNSIFRQAIRFLDEASLTNKCILYGTDKNLKSNAFLLNSIASLRANTQVKYDIVIITDKDNEFIPIYESLDNVKVLYGYNFSLNNSWVSNAGWYRFLCLSYSEFDKYDQVLYLDCDTIICSDVTSVFKYNKDEIASVTESEFKYPNDFMNQSVIGSDQVIRFRIQDYSYFNSGVILFNLFHIKDSVKLFNRIMYIAKHHYLSDQDTLNWLCALKEISRQKMPSKFNCYWPTVDVELGISDNQKGLQVVKSKTDIIIKHNTGVGLDKLKEFKNANYVDDIISMCSINSQVQDKVKQFIQDIK